MDDLERRLMFSHLGGKATGLENAAALVREQASYAFLNSKESEARNLRDLAAAIKAQGDMARKEQKAYETSTATSADAERVKP